MRHELENGYYLFIYSEIDEVMSALRASLRHDHNMTLFYKNDDEISLIHHWEFERYTGYKHHNVAFPSEKELVLFVNRLLEEEGLSLDEINSVVGMPLSFGKDISWIIDEYPTIAYHSICHMYTSLFVDSKKLYENNIISLAFDGGPDILIDKEAGKKNFFCGGVVKEGKLLDVFQIPSPGAYWAYMTNYFQISEGTLMALAYACNAKSTEHFEAFPDYKRSSDKRRFEEYMDALINRIMNYDLQMDCDKFVDYDERFSEKDNKISMIMKIVQENSIIQTHDVIDRILLEYSLDAKDTCLSLSGGYALNCPTNTELMNHYGFKEQLLCPCVNDGGLAIGMGLNYFYKYEDYPFNYKFKNAYYGSEDKRDVRSVLKKFDQYVDNVVWGLDKVAEDIEENPIVWFLSRAEIGPRALGHRSILANPCKMEHKDLLNMYKVREWWRPVAPIVLEDEIDNWFLNGFKSEYMLNNFDIRPDKAEIVPAIMHLDGTCRVQTVGEEDMVLYEIVKSFYDRTKVPIICNTSLNDHGEPIINRMEEAINFALRKNIEVIYINNFRIKLKNHGEYPVSTCYKRQDDLFVVAEEKKKEILLKYNPYHLSNDEVLIYKYNAELHKYSMSNERDANILKRIFSKVKFTSLDLQGLEQIASRSK